MGLLGEGKGKRNLFRLSDLSNRERELLRVARNREDGGEAALLVMSHVDSQKVPTDQDQRIVKR